MHPNVRLALYFFMHAVKAAHWRLVASDLIALAHEKRAELAYER